MALRPQGTGLGVAFPPGWGGGRLVFVGEPPTPFGTCQWPAYGACLVINSSSSLLLLSPVTCL